MREMTQEFLKLSDTEIEKMEFHCYKDAINKDNVGIEKNIGIR